MKRKNGYVTLIITVIISFLLMAIVLTVSTSTLSKLPLITKSQESNEIRQILGSCVEESLLRINENDELPSLVTIEENMCNINLISKFNSSWEYDVNVSKNSYIYKVKVKARREDIVILDSLNFIL